MQNVVECMREAMVTQLYDTGFSGFFPKWKPTITKYAGAKTPKQLFDLGDHLSEIFLTTRKDEMTSGLSNEETESRSQSKLSSGGAAWESLICWYLNLCLIGRRTIVIKHSKKLIPTPVSDAITVTYDNDASNSESDLIAVTFPDKPEYSIDKNQIRIKDSDGEEVRTTTTSKTGGKSYRLLPIINALVQRDFNEIEIHIIQCKTNWNDNSQIPMLWDSIYAAIDFSNNIRVGTNGYSIHNIKKFSYSFVTVPTNNLKNYKINSTPVIRVRHLSGGNYWGRTSVSGIASSLKEMLNRNLQNGSPKSILNTIGEAVPYLETTYYYFGL